MSGWPNEVIDAVTDAICNAQSEPHWPAAQHYANAALAALAPFVAAREAAAFQRGAEAMRDQVVRWLEQRPAVQGDPTKDPQAFSQSLTKTRGVLFAAHIRALPIPEDKA